MHAGFPKINDLGQRHKAIAGQITGFRASLPHAIIATMMFDARLADAWARLPDYLGGHVLVSLTALAIGLGISLPVAIASRHRPVLRGTLLTIASVVQTIPGLALLALFYPLLLAIAALSERLFGKGFSALGFLPSVLALALYSMLPVLRNTVTGLNGVDKRLSEAARVVGVPPWKLLRDIELRAAVMSKLDSSCSRMMCGSFAPGLHAAAGNFSRSATVASDSSNPWVANS